ncbi:MAG: zinc ribbon domain-containing protein, partial [Acidimicrobiia bacterium]
MATVTTTIPPPRFCPTCGQPTTPRQLEHDHRPRLVCPNGHVTWQNPR